MDRSYNPSGISAAARRTGRTVFWRLHGVRVERCFGDGTRFACAMRRPVNPMNDVLFLVGAIH
jgi:hypothetical protein